MVMGEFEFEEEDERVMGFGSHEWIRYQMKHDTGFERYSTRSEIALEAEQHP